VYVCIYVFAFVVCVVCVFVVRVQNVHCCVFRLQVRVLGSAFFAFVGLLGSLPCGHAVEYRVERSHGANDSSGVSFES
jgi:hypothetical protein